MKALADHEIKPPKKGEALPLAGSALNGLLDQLGNDWAAVDGKRLEKTFAFKDFQRALDFTNKVGELAEMADHHPEICLTWGRAKIMIWTHSIRGLSEADFVFAAKADRIAEMPR